MAKTNQKSRRVQTSGKIGAGSPSVLTDVAEISALQALPAEDKNVTSLYIVADNSDHAARNPIPFKSVENILQATAFASAIGYPLPAANSANNIFPVIDVGIGNPINAKTVGATSESFPPESFP